MVLENWRKNYKQLLCYMNSNSILVSVLTITYNHEKYIAQAIDSVLMQKTNFDFEIVIGEDCSTDRTREIVLEYKAKYPDKIRLLLQPVNKGANQNWIETYRACTGKYIALLEGDDYWTDPYKLQKQVDILEAHPEYSMCFTARNVVDSEDKILRDEHYPDKIYTTKDVVEGFIPSTQTIVLRNYLDLTKFLQKNHNHPSGDRLVAYYCSLMGPIYYMDEITACYRESGEGVWSSFDYWQKREKRFERFREFYTILGIENNNLNLIDRGFYEFYSRILSGLKNPVKTLRDIKKLYKTYLNRAPILLMLSVIYLRIKKRFLRLFNIKNKI